MKKGLIIGIIIGLIIGLIIGTYIGLSMNSTSTDVCEGLSEQECKDNESCHPLYGGSCPGGTTCTMGMRFAGCTQK